MSGAIAKAVNLDFEFDEVWYLHTYPDIAKAVRDGVVPSGRVHYVKFGRDEGRLPTAQFDPKMVCQRISHRGGGGGKH